MDSLELIMYNVGHGLALSLIEYPEKYVTQIDLGAEGNFSPLKYLLESRRLRPDILYITHPHADHLSDIGRIGTNCPDYLQYQSYDWDDVTNREISDLRWIIREYRNLLTSIPKGSYNGSARLNNWYWTPEKAKELFGESSYVNNSSLFIVYTWRGFKISICGDLETQAIERLIRYSECQKEAKNTDILIAPHHGHIQGYTSKWPEIIGKPYVSLISVQSRDPNIATGYSSSDFAKGVYIMDEKRYCLTTRKDGTIVIKMWYGDDDKLKWSFTSE